MNQFVPENAVELLIKYFFIRQDVAAGKTKGSKRPEPITAGDKLPDLLKTHLKGGKASKVRTKLFKKNGFVSGWFRVGAYTPDKSGKTKWLCFDFDGKGHADALVNPLDAAKDIFNRLSSFGFKPYLEKSGGGHGWHIWIFFDPPVSAKSARELGSKLIEAVPDNLKKTVEQQSDNPKKKQMGIEIFPKQNKINNKQGIGNMVWLPWWLGAPEGANVLYTFSDDKELKPFKPDEFKTFSENNINQVIETLNSLKSVDDNKLKDFVKTTDKTSTTNILTSDWSDWRRQVLSRIDLNTIYGRWLTGKERDEWLECRDPSSPTGDKNPSAGVATGNGSFEHGVFHSFRTGENLSIFDFMVQFNLARDFKDALQQVSKLSGVKLPVTNNKTSNNSNTTTTRLPQVTVNSRQVRDVVNDAWAALLLQNNPPFLFQRAGSITSIIDNEYGGSRIELVNEHRMLAYLNRCADWLKVTESSVTPTHPPERAARDMLSFPHENLSKLEAIVTAPVFDKNGYLISKEGYHEKSKLYYKQPEGFKLQKIADIPTNTEISDAKILLLNELLFDFPFEAESDLAHAIAALILPFARRLIYGPTPLHLIEAPTPGTGKSLLAELISLIVTGHVSQPMNFGRDEEENRKRLTSSLARGGVIINLDNIKGGLDSAVLASVLTATVWTDRWLGSAKMVDIINSALWLATANNPKLSFEMARRCIRIRLDPKVDKPWQRSGFKHPQLTRWIEQNRSNLVWAILTIIQNWIVKGSKKGIKSIGSFEAWSGVIGGILESANIENFLNNQDELYEEADAVGSEWRAFVNSWWSEYRDLPKKVSELNDFCDENNLMISSRGGRSSRSQQIRLGNALFSNRDRVFGRFKIVTVRDIRKKNKYYALNLIEHENFKAEKNHATSETNLCSATKNETLQQKKEPNVPNVSRMSEDQHSAGFLSDIPDSYESLPNVPNVDLFFTHGTDKKHINTHTHINIKDSNIRHDSAIRQSQQNQHVTMPNVKNDIRHIRQNEQNQELIENQSNETFDLLDLEDE